MKKELKALDIANRRFGGELWVIKSSLDVYCLVGLNAQKVKIGQKFLGFLQRQCLDRLVLGLAKIYEREKDYPLCSVRGLLVLTEKCMVADLSAAKPFFTKYGVDPNLSWSKGISAISKSRVKVVQKEIARIQNARNTFIAHLQQKAPIKKLPSVAAFENLLEFAVDLQSVINEIFLVNVGSHPILKDRNVAESLQRLLRMAGVKDIKIAFDD